MDSIWIYAALLGLPLLAAVGEVRPKLSRPILLMVGALLIGFVGLRREVGGDWDNYLVMFRRAGSTSWLEALTLSDPAYMALNVLVARLDLGFGLVNLCAAAILTIGLLSLVRLQPRPHLALLIALPVMVMIAGLSATRQSIALGLLCWALAGYTAGSARRAGWTLAVLPFAHWSALALTPLLLRMRWPQRPPTAWLAAAGAGLGLLAAGLAAAAPSLASAYQSAGVSAGALLRAAPTGLALGVWLLFGNRLQASDPERRILDYFTVFAAFTLVICPFLPTVGDRLGFYAIPFQMMVLPRAVMAPSRRPWRAGSHAALAALFALMLIGWLALTPYRPCFAPYRSWLTQPGALLDSAAATPRSGAACDAVREPG